MNEESPKLVEFPCDFPIKAIGLSHDGLLDLVIGIARRHAPDLDHANVTSRPSAAGKYTGVSLTIRAHSQSQLDALYSELSACPEVVMVL